MFLFCICFGLSPPCRLLLQASMASIVAKVSFAAGIRTSHWSSTLFCLLVLVKGFSTLVDELWVKGVHWVELKGEVQKQKQKQKQNQKQRSTQQHSLSRLGWRRGDNTAQTFFPM